MIRVQREDFDVGAEIAALQRGRTGIGGLAAFVGLVRDTAGGSGIRAMTLEHYPGMTEREIAAHVEEARARWPLMGVSVIHRIGKLLPGARIVLVVVASAHRAAAFEAANFLMDYLKTRAPFWKEETRQGSAHWVEARDSDNEAAKRWE